MNTYSIRLLALDTQGKPLAQHRIELWDKDPKKDDFIGEATTDAEGRCSFRFDESHFGDVGGKPDVYFRVFKEEALLSSTRSVTVFNLKFTNASITLRVGAEVTVENTRKADQIPLKVKDLRNEPGVFSGNAAVFVANKLNMALSNEVQRLLNDVEPQLLSAVKDIQLDYKVWLDKSLGDLIQEAVLPVLLQDCEIKKLLEERRLTDALIQNKRPVREVLHIDLPVYKNPLFHEDVRILITTELVTAFDLNVELAERLLEKPFNWERAGGEAWDQMVEENVITEKEKETLQRGFVLARFTGGNATLSAGLHKKLPELQDMVKWDAEDWKEMIDEAEGDTPKGETVEEYADNLVRLAQRSFPSAFFLERKVQRSLPQDTLLGELKKLQPTGGKKPAPGGGGETEKKDPISLSGSPVLQGVANTYRHLGVEELLTDPGISPTAKMETLTAKQGYLKKFTENNPDFNLRTADFFAKDETGQRKHSMTGIPEEEQAAVRNQMMAFQRVGRLGSTYDVQDAMLRAGFDSSHRIVQGDSHRLGEALSGILSGAQIRGLYAAALQQYQQMIQATLAFQSINSTNYFGLSVLDYPEELKNHLQDIDGYSAMFGDQNYCECDHCKSIFGPAAYFVDLMRFVDQQVYMIPVGWTTPMDPATKRDPHPISLKTRRPDLWNLELTCENTNRPVPYLWLINKIKITYLCQVMGIVWDSTKSFEDNAELLWAELARLPLGVTGTGGSWKNGFRVAFNRPFEESQIVLEALGVPYLEILKALEVNQAERQAAAYLGLSEEEWGILTTEDTNFDDLAYRRFSFTVNEEDDDITKWKVKVFQRATSLNREQVETLLGRPVTIDISNTLQPPPPVLSLQSLQAISTDVLLVREVVENEIQLYHEWITGLDNAAALDFIHRFLRLWRHLPAWSLRELDLAVQRVSALTPAGVLAIAQIYELQQRLTLTFEEALVIHGELPNDKIYTRQVYNEFLNLSVEEAVPGMLDRLFDQDKIKIETAPTTSTDTNGFTVPNMRVDHLTENGQLPFLLRGLGISQADYERLFGLLFGTTVPILNLKNVSDCFRFVRLAKALGLSVEELSYLLQLENNSLALDPARILRLIPLVDKVKALPVSLHEMWFISHNDADNAGNSTIQSGYIGVNEQNVPLANAAAEQWTKDFFAKKALYISKETLKTYLPAAYQETRVNDFIAALHTAGIVLPADADLGCRVLRRSTEYLPADIPAQFPNIDPVTLLPVADPAAIILEATAQAALADFLNKNYLFDQDGGASTQERLIREQLGVLLKINGSLIEDLGHWSQQFTGVLTEIESNWLLATVFQYTNLQTALPELERVAFVWNKLGFDKADIQWIQAHSGQFLTGANSNGLLSQLDTLDEFVRLSFYMRYKKQAGDDSGIAAYRNALALNKTTWFGAQSETIARVLGCEVGQLKAVGNLLKIDFTDPNTHLIIHAYDLPASATQALTKLEAILSVCKRLGIYQTDVLLALKECDYANAGHYEKALRDALRARYVTENEFEKAWEPYENRINELRRDVLCSFLLGLKDLSNFEDTGDLYAYFLVDVEMSGCARVSEILAATLSLQTYVHRVIMGLEVSVEYTVQGIIHPAVRAYLGHPTFTANNITNNDNQAEKREQWEWRKNYRVWEANRKVFLYPENWIEPELRDNKSPLFKTLEDELLQQKISLESAEGAYKEYLKGFAEVGNLVIAGVYYENKAERPVYHIFGRTQTDPYQYYYRKLQLLNRTTETPYFETVKSWTPWEKVELAIDSPLASPVLHQNKLYIFWVSVVEQEKNNFVDGTSSFDRYALTYNLKYSQLTDTGKWLQPQSVKNFYPGQYFLYTNNLTNYAKSITKYRVFPISKNGELKIDIQRGINDYYDSNKYYLIDLLNNEAIDDGDSDQFLQFNEYISLYDVSTIPRRRSLLFVDQPMSGSEVIGKLERKINNRATVSVLSPNRLSSFDNKQGKYYELRFVINKNNEHSYRVGNENFLIRTAKTNEKIETEDLLTMNMVNANREVLRIGTKVVGEFQTKLSNYGLDGFLSLNTQSLYDNSDVYFGSNTQIKPPLNLNSLDFSGSTGLYFRELFFHIPFLIADHLNAEGKYQEADYWYRKIFDPSASFENGLLNQTDRYWRFLEFRHQTMPTLKEMLTDSAAISVHENDPFNPHAIARLRISAYQKNIVMKYVDNLLDWGDSLFRRDTWESNTEAMMLYMLAKDILDDRPEKAGTCESAVEEKNCGCDHAVTYALLKEHEGFGDSPFVYYVENWVDNLTSGGNGASGGVSGGVIHIVDYEIMSQMDEVDDNSNLRLGHGADGLEPVLISSGSVLADQAVSLGFELYREEGDKLVFCVPHNENMLAYWDRVEDRLFKLRHCMNIDGVKRSLALFQPPIDPALLVNAFAAGLSVDDVLNSLYGDLPAYRFSYLVEKAKSFAGTVQIFGGALLSALEKKDSEALTLLRSTQEQNILKITKEVKKKAIEEARDNLQASVEGMINVMNRVAQYTLWIEENMNEWERTQQIALHTASGLHAADSIMKLIASITANIPQVGAPTAMTYGGFQISNSVHRWSHALNALASLANTISSSAGLEANFQRRAQDWKFQLKLAEQEIKQVQQQIAAATIRVAIAEKDLEIHDKQIEQAVEVHDFYKNKFTGLGLYNYMAKRLNTLHRIAYNTAMDMAKQAEAAYKFETGNDSTGISGGTFWDASRVGLLSGESLTLELQQLETDFINWNHRQMEIRQSFSMRMIDPNALLNLRKDGICTFTIPEWAFDMQYPGHYRRRIASVQITIPCVAGPYHNIAATLSMTKGGLRKEPVFDANADIGFPFRGSSMIATSSANNDGGQFELNFRDERFLPFEGAGAVESEWVLELPSLKIFDYDTISDVIFHISYRSKYDGGLFKTNVSTGLQAKINNNNGNGLKRLVNLKEEFPDAYYQLQTSTDFKTQVTITNGLLPFFAKNGTIVKVELYNQPTNVQLDSPSAGNYLIDLAAAPSGDVYLLITFTI